MADYTTTIKVKADNAETANKIFAALVKLAKNVKPADLVFLADKIEVDPSLIETAKQYL